MNHFQQQQQQPHVAQQSRREKLRIPGSLHPSSPNHSSDHSAGSASVLEARHQQQQQQQQQQDVPQTDSFNGGRYLHQAAGNAASINDVLYGSNVMSADPYYSTTGNSDHLLGYTTKGNGYTTGSDMLPPSGGPSGGVFSGSAITLAKNNNWTSLGGGQQQQQQQQQMGFSGNPLSITSGGPSSIPNPSASSASSAVAATLLNGGHLGRGDGMSAYISGQTDAMQQLFLMNSAYAAAAAAAGGYSDGPEVGLNNVSSIQSSQMGGQQQQQQQQQQQHFIGIPLTPSGLSQEQSGAFGAAARSSGTFNWRNGGDELLFMPSSEATQQRKLSSGGEIDHHLPDYGAAAALRQSLLGGPQQQQQQSLLQARIDMENHHQTTQQQQQQGGAAAYQSLSLSLSNQNPQLHALDTGLSSPGSAADPKRSVQKLSSDLSHFRTSPRDTLAVSSTFSFVSGSRYLRAAQQLLDEVCSVGRGLKGSKAGRGSQGTGGSPTAITSGSAQKEVTTGVTTENNSVKSEVTMGSSVVPSPSGPSAAAATSSVVAPSNTTAESRDNVAVLTPEEKQDHEGKKTKLLAMLQEVDRRYRQYYDQMQVVITSFDTVAGVGAATPYTALALQAMSRYFRCLRDAITGQIQITCKALGEEDVTKSITSRPLTSRLRFIDQQIRQQRAYQQYGMLQQHAWRPQRGLPERSVSILRAWLFEHFLHPYPKDADKMMLARQTGLTRSQVSNWFINARVRLWKPMVEEMYQEETKEHELGTSSVRLSVDTEDKHHQDNMDLHEKLSKHHHDHRQDMAGVVEHHHHHQGHHHHHQDHQSYGDYGNMMKKTRLGGIHDSLGMLDAGGSTMDVMEVKDGDGSMDGSKYGAYIQHDQQAQNYGVHQTTVDSYGRYGGAPSGGGGYATQYPGGSGVSLTLGLRHCDNLHLAAAAGPHQFLQQGGQNFLAAAGRGAISASDGSELCNIYGAAAAAAGGGAHIHIGEHDGMDYQGRKQQHMEGHLLHDFVA